MRPLACRLGELLDLPCAAALAALHREAAALAAAVRSRAHGLEVSVSTDEAGAVLRIAGPGLAAREHGTADVAPAGNLFDLAEDAAGIPAAVAAAVAGVLGRA